MPSKRTAVSVEENGNDAATLEGRQADMEKPTEGVENDAPRINMNIVGSEQ